MFCRRVREGLEQAESDRKRELLELLVDRVIVTDGDVEIRYVIPTGPDGEREPLCRLRTDYLWLHAHFSPGRGVGEHPPPLRGHAARGRWAGGPSHGGDRRHPE